MTNRRMNRGSGERSRPAALHRQAKRRTEETVRRCEWAEVRHVLLLHEEAPCHWEARKMLIIQVRSRSKDTSKPRYRLLPSDTEYHGNPAFSVTLRRVCYGW